MVQYLNVNIGQRVEVRHQGHLLRGVVRYKGSVITKRGDWVGIELDTPVGQHNGTYLARFYFNCRPQHGIFVESSNIRFIPLKRCLYSRYHRVGDKEAEQCEEDLFRTIMSSIHPANRPDEGDRDEVISREPLDILPYGDSRPKMRSQYGFPKSSILSRERLPANNPKRSKSALPSSSSFLSHIYMRSADDEFCSTPSIPKTHMPHDDQVNLVKRGWGDNHLIRERTVSTFRDSLSGRFWNDVSF